MGTSSPLAALFGHTALFDAITLVRRCIPITRPTCQPSPRRPIELVQAGFILPADAALMKAAAAASEIGMSCSNPA